MEGKPPEKLYLTELTYRHSRNGAPAQPPMSFVNSLGIPSRADQPFPLTAEYFQGLTTSQNGLQTNRDTMGIPFHSVPEPSVHNGVTNDPAFQMRSTAPTNTPLADPTVIVPALIPNGHNPGQDEPNVGCVYHLLLSSPSLNGVPVYPIGLHWPSRVPETGRTLLLSVVITSSHSI